jgi:hypothetical protein
LILIFDDDERVRHHELIDIGFFPFPSFMDCLGLVNSVCLGLIDSFGRRVETQGFPLKEGDGGCPKKRIYDGPAA